VQSLTSLNNKKREKIIKYAFFILIISIIIASLGMKFCTSAETCRKAQPWDVVEMGCTEEEFAATGGCSREIGPICETSKSGCYDKLLFPFIFLIPGFFAILLYGYKGSRKVYGLVYTRFSLDWLFALGLVLMGIGIIILLYALTKINF